MSTIWTEEKIREVQERHRGMQRKYTRKLIPKKTATHKFLIKETSKRTGIAATDVQKIIEEYFRVVFDMVAIGKKVAIIGFGIFYRMLFGGRVYEGIAAGKTPVYRAPHWRMTFKPSLQIKAKMKEIEVTEEDCEIPYVDAELRAKIDEKLRRRAEFSRKFHNGEIPLKTKKKADEDK